MYWSDYSKSEKRRGCELLATLLPRAVKQQSKEGTLNPVTADGARRAAVWPGGSLQAVMIRSVKGGWIADLIIFASDGYIDVIGSPERAPIKTRREAEDVAVTMLAGVLPCLKDEQGLVSMFPDIDAVL